MQAYGAQAYEGSGGKERADENLRRFVEAHLVTQSPWPSGDKAKTVAGRVVWWEEREGGKRVVMPDEVEVEQVAIEVANGQLVSLLRVDCVAGFWMCFANVAVQWILKGVLNTA